jgi:hypothetical protein
MITNLFDEEIQDLLKFSVGLNLGFAFLSMQLPLTLVSKVDPLRSCRIIR